MLDLELVQRAEFGQVGFMLEGQFERVDDVGGDVFEVEDGAFFDLAIGGVAVGFAQPDRGVSLSVFGGPLGAIDIHVHIDRDIFYKSQVLFLIMHVYM